MVPVTARSTHGESHKALKGQFRLPQSSIDSLDDVAEECFLDLGLFPGDRKICADALLDIWVYVRKLQKHDAFAILSELASRNLLNLISNSRRSTTISYGNGNASELYFSQRDGMQDFALYLGFQRERLVIERKSFGSLVKWELLGDRASDTKILSILTGPMEENDWYDMTFTETEVLMLFFTSTECVLPPFLKSMKKLKFLMVSNCGTQKVIVKGLDVLFSLTQLKSVRFERLISPLDVKQSIEALQNIEKLSLSLCEGFQNISSFTKLTEVQDYNQDLPLEMLPRKSDLEEKDIIVLSISVLIPANFALLPFIEDATPLVALLSALSSLVALFLFMLQTGLGSAVLKTLLGLALLLSCCSYLAIMATKLWAISKAGAITLFVFGAMLVFGAITVFLSRSVRTKNTRPATTGAEALLRLGSIGGFL